jgi:hypothetical protein
MFRPRERRIWDLFRRPDQPLAFAVSDTTRVDDAAQMNTFHATLSHKLIRGSHGIPSAEAFGTGGSVTNS